MVQLLPLTKWFFIQISITYETFHRTIVKMQNKPNLCLNDWHSDELSKRKSGLTILVNLFIQGKNVIW